MPLYRPITGSSVVDGTIAKADLDASVQASLDLADSALQVAPVTSVDGDTGAVDLTGTYAVKPARGTAAALAAQVLTAGQKGIETDTGFERTGDGSTAFSALPVVAGPEDLRWVPAVSLSSTTGSPGFSATAAGSRFAAWGLDAATNEQVSTTFMIPAHWGRWNLDLYWCNLGAGSGDVQWRPTYSVRADGTDMSAGDVVGSDAIVTAPVLNIVKVTRLVSAATRAAGLYHVRILRRADQAGDTLSNDAGVLGILLGKA